MRSKQHVASEAHADAPNAGNRGSARIGGALPSPAPTSEALISRPCRQVRQAPLHSSLTWSNLASVMNWFWDQRQRWIAETIGIFGFINREHIMRKFGVSTPQASADLRDFQRAHPDALVYNKTSKRYERQETCR